MLLKTSTLYAPWTVVEGNDKLYARIKILRTVVEKLSEELKYDPFKSDVYLGSTRGKDKKKKKQS